jgi:hypothetical protein
MSVRRSSYNHIIGRISFERGAEFVVGESVYRSMKISDGEKEAIISHDSLSSQHRPTLPLTTPVSPYCAVFAQYYS